MTSYTWTGAAHDDNFNNPANWQPAQVPGSGDTATISSATALTLNVSNTLANLITGPHVTLTVGDYQTLQIGNGGATARLANGGTILLGNGHDAGLVLDAKTTTLSGGGTIEITNRVIQASAAGQALNNTNNVIEGSGDLGYGTLTFANAAAGIVDANQSGATLDVNTGTVAIANGGLLEATSGGTLQIDSSVTNAGNGAISADGGIVTLTSGTISGGTLSATNGGTIYDDGNVTLNGSTAALVLQGNFQVTDYSQLTLHGTITNTGTLSEAYVHGAGILVGSVAGGLVDLNGGGTVILANALQEAGKGDRLINVDNTIQGFGTIGNGTSLAILNEAAGTIDATGGLALATGTATLVNDGLIEATTGTLSIASAISNAATAHLSAAGGNIYLQDGSSVAGGTLASSGGAAIVVTSGSTLSVLNGTAGLTNTGTIQIADYSTAILLGTITNQGLIAESYVHGTGLIAGLGTGAAGTVTLTGGGTVTLASALVAGQSGETLLNVNNTINGYDELGAGSNFAIVNGAAGVIDATGGLTLDTGTVTTLNAGLIEATATATTAGALTIDTTVNNGARGQIAASGANVTLSDAAVIEGGTLTSSGTGRFVIDGLANNMLGVLDGTQNAITNDAFIEVTDYDGLLIEGTFINNGTLHNDYVHGAGIVIGQGTVFTNNGTLQANALNTTFGAGTTLTNDVRGTLTGGTYQALGANLSFAAPVVTTLAAGTVLDERGGGILFDGKDVSASLRTVQAGATLVIENGSYTGTQSLTNAGTLQLNGASYGVGTLTNQAKAAIVGNGAITASLTSAGLIDATTGELDLAGKSNSLGGTIAGAAGDFVGFGQNGGTTTLLGSAVITASDLAVLYGSTLHLAARLSFAGTLQLNGMVNVTGGALALSGLLEQRGDGSGQGTITGALSSTGTIQIDQGGTLSVLSGLANTGLILANGGLVDPHALTGGTLSIGASGSATLATAAPAASTLAVLDSAGGALTTNGVLTVTRDYDNTAAGTGNSYMPFAGVNGTIDARGTKLAIVGVQGTTVSVVNGVETIKIAAGGTAHFEIRNAGAGGSTALRGALQTSVNGGSITGTALSGSGVTAGNFGPIAAGANSAIYDITYAGGQLSGAAIHLASDFANVAGLTVDIVAAPPAQPAMGIGHADVAVRPDLLAWHHFA